MEKKQNKEKCTGTFTKRIGNTNYRVNVHFAENTTDTVADKLLCQIGGIVEKVLDRPLVEEDVMRLLNFLNQQERNGKYFTRAMEKCPDTGSEMEGAKNE